LIETCKLNGVEPYPYLTDVLTRMVDAQPEAGDTNGDQTNEPLSHPCPCCGGRMVIIETLQRGFSPRYHPAASTAVIRIDTS
jgi:hypothetical protein